MDEVNTALQKVARGAGIIFFGGMFGILLRFAYTTIIARYFERTQYGTFNLALTLASVGMIIAVIGLPSALPREIARYQKKALHKAYYISSIALALTIFVSSIIGLFYIFFSQPISKMFNDPQLACALKYMALALPFMSTSSILVAISRGFGRIQENLYYQRILYPALYLLGVLIIVHAKLGFITLFIIYIVVQCIITVLLFYKLRTLNFLKVTLSCKDNAIAKDLISFSVPLMLAGMMGYIMSWTDTLMLGHYFNSDVVGIYNAAAPLAKFIPVLLSSAGFLFMPIATRFFVQGKLDELKRIYTITTRWVFLPTFPIFLLLLTFPRTTITSLFGVKYAAAAPALQILAIGFMFHTILGLNGMTLIVVGKSNVNLVGNIFAAASNVALNFLLIPHYGTKGAAVATSTSYLVANVFRTGWLYKNIKIHPFGKSYRVQLFTALIFTTILNIFAPRDVDFVKALSVVGVTSIVYFLIVLVLRTVEKEDLELITAISRKFNLNMEIFIKLLEKFVSVKS